MSVAEIINELQKLPRAEQERVFTFLQRARSQQSKSAEARPHHATDAQFERSAQKVLREHADLFRRLAQ